MNNNVVKGEMMKLPIGFRFRPTDEELVVHYLKRRALCLPLPASVIPDLHPFNFDPWSLPGDLKEKRYYFWKRKGNKCSQVMPTSSGFWKVIGKGKQITSSGARNDIVGTRKTWAFYPVKSQPHGQQHWPKTRWLMHEFRLVDSIHQNGTNQAGDWVVFRVFQRKLKQKNQGLIARKCICCAIASNVDGCNMGNGCSSSSSSPTCFDFKRESNFDLGPPQPLSPCSTTD